jgi:hypothetical protein
MFKFNGFDSILRTDGIAATTFDHIENLTSNDNVSAFDLNRPLSNLASNDFDTYSFLEKLARQLYNKNGVFSDSLNSAFNLNTDTDIVKLDFGNANITPFVSNYKTFLRVSPGVAGVGYTQDRSQEGWLVVNKPEIEIAERQLATALGLSVLDDIEYVKIKYNYKTKTYKMRIVKVSTVGVPTTYDFTNGEAFEDDTLGLGYFSFIHMLSKLYSDTANANLLTNFFYKDRPEDLINIVCEPLFLLEDTASVRYLKINNFGNFVYDTSAPIAGEFPLWSFQVSGITGSGARTVSNLTDLRVIYENKVLYTQKIDFNTAAETTDYSWIYSSIEGSDTIMNLRIGTDTTDKIRLEYFNGTSAAPIAEFYGENLTSKFYGYTIFGDSYSDLITINSTIVSNLIFDDNNRYIKLGGSTGSVTNRTLFIQNDGTGIAYLTVEGDITTTKGAIITGNTTSYLMDTVATTLNIGGAATTLNLGYDGTAAISTTNINTGVLSGAYTKTVNIATAGTTGSTTAVNIGSIVGSGAINLHNYTINLGTSTANATTTTIGGAITGNTLKLSSVDAGTINYTTDITAGGIVNFLTSLTTSTLNIATGITTGTVNIATAGASTVNIGKSDAAAKLYIGGSGAIVDITSSTGTANVFNTNSTTVNAFGAASALNIANTNTATQTINIGNAITTNNQTIGIGTGITSGNQIINIGTGLNAGTQTINIGKSTSSNTSTINILNDTPSTTISTGALVVTGGVGIKEKLFVANSITTDTGVYNTGTTTGDLYNQSTVTGIVDIANYSRTINIGTSTTAAQTITIGKAALVGSYVLIANTDDATTYNNTGALRVAGGVSIVKKLHVGESIITDTGVVSSDTTTGSLFSTSGTTGSVTLADYATTINIGNNFGAAQTINIGNTATGFTQNINIGTAITSAAQIIHIGKSGNTSSTLYIDNTTTSSTSTAGALVVAGAVGFKNQLYVAGNVKIENGYLKTGATTSYLYGDTATTLYLGSVAQNLYIATTPAANQIISIGATGANSYTQTLNIGTGLTTTAQILNIGTGLTSGVQTINIGTGAAMAATQAINIGSSASSTGYVSVLNTTEATNAGVASIKTSGGLYVAKKAFIVGDFEVYSTTTKFKVATATGNTTIAGTLAVNNAVISTDDDTFSLINTTATTVSFAGAATTLNIANTTTAAQTINIGTAVNTTTAQTITFGKVTNTVSKVLIAPVTNSTSVSSGALVVNGGVGIGEDVYIGATLNVNGTTALTGDTTITGNLNVNGGTLNSTTSPFNLLATPTTINFGDAATTMTIGASSAGVTTFRNTTDATSSTGSVILTGGLLIKKKLYVTTGATFASTVAITGNTTMTGVLAVNGGELNTSDSTFSLLTNTTGQVITMAHADVNSYVNIQATKVSSAYNNGALVVAGGVGIAGAVNTNSTMFVSSNFTTDGIINANGAYINSNDATFYLLDNASVSTAINFGRNAASIVIGKTVSSSITLQPDTDASSSTVAGVKVVGGLAVAKKAYIGTDLYVGTNTYLTGDLAIYGGDLTTNITTGSFNVFNSGLTGTLNIAGATNAVNIGSASSITTLGNDLYVTGNQVRIASKYEFNYDSTTNTLDLVYVG